MARLTGVAAAIGTVWFTGILIVRLFNKDFRADLSTGTALLAIGFLLVMALLLLNVRAEKPENRDG